MKNKNKSKFKKILEFILWSIPILLIQASIFAIIKDNFDLPYFYEYIAIGMMSLSLTIVWYLLGVSDKYSLN